MKKLILSLFAVILLVSIYQIPAHAGYSDTDGHWAQDSITRWSEEGVLTGNDGKFNPDDSVTRAELSKIIFTVMEYPVLEGRSYKDVSKGDWFYDYISTLAAMDIIEPEGEYIYPDEALTREEAVYMLAYGFGNIRRDSKKLEVPFTDAADITEKYLQRVEAMQIYKLVSGYPDGSFHPTDKISRAEIVTILNNMIDHHITEPGEYELNSGDTALVKSTGVTLNYTRETGDDPYESILFLTLEANKGIEVNSAALSCRVSVFAIAEERSTYVTTTSDQRDMTLSIRSSIELKTVKFNLRFQGGNGTKESPYLISNAKQFEEIRDCNTNSVGKSMPSFKLTKDITLPDNFTPIGLNEDHSTTSFMANLDGDGHTITYNIKSNNYTAQNVALFAETSLFSSITNLTVSGEIDITIADGAKVNGSVKYSNTVAGLVAINMGHIENCHSDMKITVKMKNTDATELSVGGLIGENATIYTVADCSSSAKINVDMKDVPFCDSSVGGLCAGTSSGAGIVNSWSDAKIVVNGGYFIRAGVLIGHMSMQPGSSRPAPVVRDCYALGSVKGAGADFQVDTGGIAGQLTYGTIERCWSFTEASSAGSFAYLNVGGIAGSCYYGSIKDSFANSSLLKTEGARAGGIVGRLGVSGSVTDCFTVGVHSKNSLNAIVYEGLNEGTVAGCKDLSHMSAAAALSAFIEACSWDFDDIWVIGSQNYPYLKDSDVEKQKSALPA